MILADHFTEPLRAHAISQRARQILVEAGGGEQVAHRISPATWW